MKKGTKVTILLSLFFILLGATPAMGGDFQGPGFSISLPAKYELVNPATSDIVLQFTSPHSIIHIYQQELGPRLSVRSYIDYGNKQLYKGKANFKLLKRTRKIEKNCGVEELTYFRPEIKTFEQDLNYYIEQHRIFKDRVVTFWGKTTKDNLSDLKKDLDSAAATLKREGLLHKASTADNNADNTEPESPHISYAGKQLTLDIPPHNLLWGRFYPGVPFYSSCYNSMLSSEEKLDHKFEFIMTYSIFPSDTGFPEAAVRKVYQDGRVLMLTLQPFTADLEWIAVLEFIAGEHDDVIREWAEGLKRINEPVFVRPLNEMNGDWDPWCAWFFGKDTDLYIKAWRHIVDIFKEVGADNVLFVWNPHDRSYPNFTWNNPHLYYPGDEYVDWIGLTGYNNGTSYPGDVWREFEKIYRPIYEDYLKRYPDKPMMITEFSSNETGGNKAAWIENAMQLLAQDYPNIKIATWFDGRDKKWQYELESSPQAFAAFQKGLHNHYFLTDAVTQTSQDSPPVNSNN